jgi:hypothetical protein
MIMASSWSVKEREREHLRGTKGEREEKGREHREEV